MKKRSHDEYIESQGDGGVTWLGDGKKKKPATTKKGSAKPATKKGGSSGKK